MEQLPRIEISGPYQTRPNDWSPELTAFGDALEAVLKEGKHDLKDIVAGLNDRHHTAPDGSVWTEATLKARLAELDR